MKTKLCLLTAGVMSFSGAAMATEYGTVVSSTPVMAQVPVPQRQCVDSEVTVQPPNSGGGALLGAVIGGVVGNAIGSGAGRAAATGLGVIAGSVIGDRVEANGNPATTVPTRQCQTVTQYQSRVVGYDVVYDYNGQRYRATLAQDPGERIALNIGPAAGTVTAPAQAPLPPQAVVDAPPVTAPPTVVVAPPVVYANAYPYGYPYAYPYGVYAPPVYGSVVIGVGGGYAGRGGHHGRWR